jgi:DNA-binding NtrC family response regulator
MIPPTTPSLLIVEDEPGLRIALRANFVREHWQVETAAGLREALLMLQRARFDLVLCDMRIADGDGFEVMQAVRGTAPDTSFLFLTAYGSVPEAVRAMQGGAIDYLTKPVSFEHLRSVAMRILRERPSAPAPAADTDPGATVGGMVGRSRALQAALGRARAAAESDADVLIEAESGTGKELLARMIHDGSVRRKGPFIAINCTALPEALLESELFGHARGAFTGALAAKPGTFELANGGTLLLDEIGDMPLNLQPKLLRVLQERVVERLGESRPVRTDIRVIASTNVQLGNRVNSGLFRSDLFYRLNVIPLTLPPLRERMEDLPLLAQHFAAGFAARTGRSVRLHPSFLDRVAEYSWPGNIREFGNFMQRVLSLCGSEGELGAMHFDREHRPVHLLQAGPAAQAGRTPQPPLSMDQVERTHLQHTLELVGGNRTRAAEILGISVRTMRNKIRQYDLPPRRYA